MMPKNSDPNSNAPVSRDQEPHEDPASSGPPARREISGPGASDFLTASGGLDTPETDPAKGVRGAGGEGALTEPGRLTPKLDDPSPTTEREIRSGDGDPQRDSD